MVKPIVIFYKRIIMKEDKEVAQVLIQWDSFLPEEATWEHEDFIDQQFSTLILEDKNTLHLRGNVVTNIEQRGEKKRIINPDSILLAKGVYS